MKKIVIIIFAIMLAIYSQAQEIITGPQYRASTISSVDVMSAHLLLFQAQAQYNKVLNNMSLTSHVAPSRFYLNDGSIANGTLSRILIPANVGWSNEDGSFGFFVGGNEDFVTASYQGETYRLMQGIAYMGLSLFGFQLDYGYMIDQGFKLDANLEFPKNKTEIASDDSKFSKNNDKRIFSIYHVSGCYLSTIFAKPWNGNESYSLSEFKVNIQPLKNKIPFLKKIGLPFLDLTAYKPVKESFNDLKSYYSKEYIDNLKNASFKNYDFTIGSDNILNKQIRGAIKTQVYPKPAFKSAEMSYAKFFNDNAQLIGARTQIYLQNNMPEISFDAFAIVSRNEKKNLTISVSYSYNSPDNTTFIPLQKMHVFGIQFIFGKRETARPVVPYAASVLAEESNNNSYSKRRK